MTRTQIDCFLAVRATRSFSKAANSLYISQPAISKNISKLESVLGFELFERNGSTLEVTPAGELFYEYIESSDAAFFKMMEAVRKLGGNPGTVHLGCPETWDLSFIMDAVGTVSNVQIQTHKLSDLLDKLASGKLDAVITHDFYSSVLPGLTVRNLTYSDVGILYSKEHFGTVTSVKDFKDTSFIVFDRDIEKRFAALIKKICGGHGFNPPIIQRAQLPMALFDVSRGTGVMLFTNWDSAATNSNYSFFTLDEKFPVKIIYSADDASKDTINVVNYLMGHNWGSK